MKVLRKPWNYIRQRKWLKIPIIILGVYILLLVIIPLPHPLFSSDYATVLEDRDGQLLSATLSKDQQWRFPPADSVPYKFRTAIRLFEDEYFYLHPGINPVSVIRAAKQNIVAGEIVSGGSTITMQTIRLALSKPERTVLQKLYEMHLAIKLDLLYSKKEILLMYTSHAPFGGNIVGISAASWRYYGRPPDMLSWSEAASLAVLPNNPGAVFPGRAHEEFLRKRNFLIDKLQAKGYISLSEAQLAKDENLPGQAKDLPRHAPHLLTRSIKEGMRGKTVRTTLDRDLQLQATERVNRYSKKMQANGINNAAAIIIGIQAGNTLAYIGNIDDDGSDNGQFVDIITSERSTGSLLKPLLYAAAMDEGICLPKELLPDIPMFYEGFAPKNFDKKFRGAVQADKALTGSLNVPFVFLLRDYGYEKFHQILKRMGMYSLDKPAGHYGLSLILGGADASLWELTAIYAGLARTLNASKNPYFPNSYVQAINTAGKPHKEQGVLLEPPSVYYALLAMQELVRPEESSGWDYFGSARPISWKTGTSYGFKDGWAIGLNSKYVVGVWLGNADGEGRAGLTGVQAAAPLMFDLFKLLDGDADLAVPYMKTFSVCRESGLIATDRCSNTVEMQLDENMTGGKLCSYHKLLNLNHDTTWQVNSSCYPLSDIIQKSWFILPPIQSWYYRLYHTEYQEPPPFLEGCITDDINNNMELIYPRQFTKIYVPLEQDGKPGLTIFEAAHRDEDATIYWHLDNTFIAATTKNHQLGLYPGKGLHRLTLIDSKGGELVKHFEIINE